MIRRGFPLAQCASVEHGRSRQRDSVVVAFVVAVGGFGFEGAATNEGVCPSREVNDAAVGFSGAERTLMG